MPPRPQAGMLQRDRFVILLIGLFALLFGVAVANLFAPGSHIFTARLIVVVFFSIMVLAAINTVIENRRSLLIVLALAVPAVLLYIAGLFTDRLEILALRYCLTIAVLGYTIVVILRFLFVPQRVNANLICGSLCAYLLLGILWAIIFSLIDAMEPGSFRFTMSSDIEKPLMQFDGGEASLAIYYSFVTLTTLGYGDVIPRSTPARLLAALEALMGQIYLAVLVARLVGLHVAHASAWHSGRPPETKGGIQHDQGLKSLKEGEEK
jgi:voltage-gated potassium channel